jgi:hypothetical protein
MGVGGEVAQTMYTHVSKFKNDKIKGGGKEYITKKKSYRQVKCLKIMKK